MYDFTSLERLRSELRRPGRSQSDLARALGVHPSAVNKILAGKRDVKARELLTIEGYLRATDPDGLAQLVAEEEAVGIATGELKYGLALPSPHLAGASVLRNAELAREAYALLFNYVSERKDKDVVLTSWWLISQELKALVCGYFYDLDEADFNHFVHQESGLDDVKLLTHLARRFGILNDLEMRTLRHLSLAAEALNEASQDLPEEAVRHLVIFTQIDVAADPNQLRAQVAIETLSYLSRMLGVAQRSLKHVAEQAAAVAKRRKVTEKGSV